MKEIHISFKPIAKNGKQSITSMSAYRSNLKLQNISDNKVFDYTRRKNNILSCLFVEDEKVITDKKELISETPLYWACNEIKENRKDSRIAKEVLFSLPAEVDDEARQRIALTFAKYLKNKYNAMLQVDIHKPTLKNNDKNYHCHILISSRQLVHKHHFGEKILLDKKNAWLKEHGYPTSQAQMKEIRQELTSIINKEFENLQVLDDGKVKKLTYLSFKERKKQYLQECFDNPNMRIDFLNPIMWQKPSFHVYDKSQIKKRDEALKTYNKVRYSIAEKIDKIAEKVKSPLLDREIFLNLFQVLDDWILEYLELNSFEIEYKENNLINFFTRFNKDFYEKILLKEILSEMTNKYKELLEIHKDNEKIQEVFSNYQKILDQEKQRKEIPTVETESEVNEIDSKNITTDEQDPEDIEVTIIEDKQDERKNSMGM